MCPFVAKPDFEENLSKKLSKADKSEFLKFKCDECDFWGPNAHTMKMHYFRLHCENVSCGSCNLEVKDV